jgi:hypothetical protein
MAVTQATVFRKLDEPIGSGAFAVYTDARDGFS